MPLPIPKLDDKRFDELLEEARRLIPRYAPQWTDHNLHDPGITIIELFAWLIEMQMYYLNQLPEKNYLKYLRLLGLGTRPKPASPAKVDLTFFSNKVVPIPETTELVAKSGQEDITFETDEAIDVLPIELKKIVSYSNYKFTVVDVEEYNVVDVEEYNKQRRTLYYAFGENAERGNELYIGFQLKGEEGIDQVLEAVDEIKITFNLFENDLPPVGTHGEEELKVYPSVELKWEYRGEGEWKSLGIENDQTNNLTRSGRIAFSTIETTNSETKKIKMVEYHFPPVEGNFYWIRCRVMKQGYEIPPRIHTILMNTVSATEGITVKGESPKTEQGETSSSGLPAQIFSTEYKPILAGSQKLSIVEEWEAVDDFDASGPNSNHYLLDRTEGKVIFGNGINARIPPKDAEIKIDYRYGGGEKGNIGAGAGWQLSNADGTLNDIEDINNLFPASQGKDEESIDEAKLRARKELKIPYRAIASEDFEAIVKSTPGLRTARAGVRVLPDKNKVEVAVVPYSLSERPMPSEGFKRTVCEHLDKHRLITTQIEVVEPHYVRVSVSASVKIKPRSSPERVKERVEEALDTFLHPLKGGPEGNGWPFGRDVYKSEIYEVIEKVDGVDGVVDLSLSKDGEIKELTLVYPGRHRIRIISPEIVCKEESIHG